MARYEFVLGSQLLRISDDTRDQVNKLELSDSSDNDQAGLARELSNINGIVGITFNPSEIIIRKAKTLEWVGLIPQIALLIEAYYAPTIPSTQVER